MSQERIEAGLVIAPEEIQLTPEAKRKHLRRFNRMLGEIKKLDPEMPLQQLLAFITIAMDEGEGLTVSEVAEAVGNSQPAASRNIGILGDYGRGNSPCLGVVRAVTDSQDRRKARVRLSPKGERVIDEIVKIMIKEA